MESTFFVQLYPYNSVNIWNTLFGYNDNGKLLYVFLDQSAKSLYVKVK